MIIEQEKRVFANKGFEPDKTHTIDLSSKAFEILSSSLYSDREKAVVREITCNAMDAHVAAGTTDRAFDVHAPTYIEPYFSVRDYGTGLSFEDMNGLYTTLFRSTKENSNDFVGALGLGKMSPFAVTDVYQVTSFFEDKKMMFTVFLNDKKIPSIKHLGTFDSEEDNGLYVEVPTSNEQGFSIAIDSFFDTFTGEFNFIGKQFTFNHDGLFYSSQDYKFFEGCGYEKIIAVQGNVAYPINLDLIGLSFDISPNFSDKKFELVIEFPIGSLDFQASREDLSYTDRTKKILKNKLESLFDNLIKTFEKEVDDASDIIDIFSILDKCRKFGGHVSRRLEDYIESKFGDYERVNITKKFLNDNGLIIKKYKKHSGFYRVDNDRYGMFQNSTIKSMSTKTLIKNDNIYFADNSLIPSRLRSLEEVVTDRYAEQIKYVIIPKDGDFKKDMSDAHSKLEELISDQMFGIDYKLPKISNIKYKKSESTSIRRKYLYDVLVTNGIDIKIIKDKKETDPGFDVKNEDYYSNCCYVTDINEISKNDIYILEAMSIEVILRRKGDLEKGQIHLLEFIKEFKKSKRYDKCVNVFKIKKMKELRHDNLQHIEYAYLPENTRVREFMRVVDHVNHKNFMVSPIFFSVIKNTTLFTDINDIMGCIEKSFNKEAKIILDNKLINIMTRVSRNRLKKEEIDYIKSIVFKELNSPIFHRRMKNNKVDFFVDYE